MGGAFGCSAATVLAIGALFLTPSSSAAVGHTVCGLHIAVSVTPPVTQSPVAETKEWYTQGPWPLVGAAAALVLTNAVAVGVVYLQSTRAFNAILRQRKIEALSTSLRDFYNPLLAILDINGEIFRQTGPPSFPEGKIEQDAAALIWNEAKDIIRANNSRILEILRTSTHLLHQTDSLASYNALMIHVAMYETFKTFPTDLYRNFRFPRDVRSHVEDIRAKVLEDFNSLTGSQL